MEFLKIFWNVFKVMLSMIGVPVLAMILGIELAGIVRHDVITSIIVVVIVLFSSSWVLSWLAKFGLLW